MLDPFWIDGCRIEPARNVIVGDSSLTDPLAADAQPPAMHQIAPVEPKVMAVLCLLAQHQGQVVERTTLLDRIWSRQEVSDEILTRAISVLRKTFRLFASEPVIETISKRGYRLVPEVRFSSGDTNKPSVEPLEAIAVMPFENLSADDSQDFLARGVTRDLANLLSRIPGLRVVPPVTTESLTHAPLSAADAGRALNARYLVTGELETRQSRFRLRTALTDAHSERLIWSSNQDEEMDTFFDVQDQLIHGIATALSTEVSVDRVQSLAARPEFSLNAYEHVQLAEEARRRYGREAAQAVVFHLQKALELQAQNIEAHAYLAEQHSQNLVSRFAENPAQELERMEHHLHRAQMLAPSDPRVLRAAGVVAVMAGAFDEAYAATDESIRHNPNDPHTQALHGFSMGMTGDIIGGLQRIEVAERSAPAHPRFSLWPQYRGWLYYRQQDLDRFARAMTQAIQRNPLYYPPYYHLAYAYLRLNKPSESTKALQKGVQMGPNYTTDDYLTGMTRLGFASIFEAAEWEVLRARWDEAQRSLQVIGGA